MEKETDQQLKDTFQVSLDQARDIINLSFLKYEIINSVRRTELVEETILSILNQNSSKSFDVLIDFAEMGKTSGDLASEKSKELYMRMLKQKQIKKTAIILYRNPVLETMINIMTKVTGKSEQVKIFNNRTEALTWIKK